MFYARRLSKDVPAPSPLPGQHSYTQQEASSSSSGSTQGAFATPVSSYHPHPHLEKTQSAGSVNMNSLQALKQHSWEKPQNSRSFEGPSNSNFKSPSDSYSEESPLSPTRGYQALFGRNNSNSTSTGEYGFTRSMRQHQQHPSQWSSSLARVYGR